MAVNTRIKYSGQQLSIKKDGASTYVAVHGAQSCSMSMSFNLQQIFELGQLNLYDNVEDLPDGEVTAQKLLDGYPLMWCMSSQATTTPTLNARSTTKSLVAVSYYPDTYDSATGIGASEVETSGDFVSSLRYSFPVDGFFTEDITWVNNNRVWANDSKMLQSAPWAGATTLGISGAFSSNNDAPVGSGGANRRQNIIFTYNPANGLDSNGMVADPDCTILPPEVFGISSSGTNEKTGSDYNAHVQGITISVSLNRDALNELGRRGPYSRPAQFPTEVTTEITAIATSGDMISGTEDGILTTGSAVCASAAGNLRNRTIRVATCEGTRIYCGLKNKLSSVNISGGDASSNASNIEVSYTFSNFNVMTVIHSSNYEDNGPAFWSSRASYLVN